MNKIPIVGDRDELFHIFCVFYAIKMQMGNRKHVQYSLGETCNLLVCLSTDLERVANVLCLGPRQTSERFVRNLFIRRGYS